MAENWVNDKCVQRAGRQGGMAEVKFKRAFLVALFEEMIPKRFCIRNGMGT